MYSYFIYINFQQTKLAGKSRAMQTLDIFFSLLQLQNTVGREENTSYLLSTA